VADNLTPKQRSFAMSRVKGKETGLERKVRSELFRRGLRFRKNAQNLPGKPDITFNRLKVAVFLDGDFWHGYRFPSWSHTQSSFWQDKIGKTRLRDRRNFAKLRKMGWKVIRIWQHQIEKDFEGSIQKIVCAVR
jgi:DNA mismatch endonuclease (patch repair protein)